MLFWASAGAQSIYRSDLNVGQNWGTIRLFRVIKLQVNGPIVNAYRYRVAGVTNWTSIQGMTAMVPRDIVTLSASKPVPPGFNVSMSGTVVTISAQTYVVEFDFNNNGVADGAGSVMTPVGEFKLFWSGSTSQSYFDRTCDPVTITLNTGGEPTINVSDPLPPQWDNDNDGIGDDQDPDDDNDGIPDNLDMFPKDPAEKSDSDGDGVGDNSDPDRDGDGVPNDQDKFPGNPSESADHDGDGIGDNIDWDDDNDGLWDSKDPDPKGPIGAKPPGTGGGGGGDGDGGIGNPINPGVPGDTDIGDLGSPGGLATRDKAWMDSQVGTQLPSPLDGIGDFAVDGLAEDIKAAGTGMKNALSGWQPFQTYVPSGDMTSMVADLGRFGSINIPFPTDPSTIGIFRGCCLFALYWGAVLSVMRILKV